MPLNDLTLDQLRKLSDWLTSIAVAGFRMEQDGLAPRFDLTPGEPIRITLAAHMPDYLVSRAPRVDISGAGTFEISLPSFLQPQSTEAALPAVSAEPVEPPSAAGELAGGGVPPVDQPGPPGGASFSAAPSRSDEAVAPPKATVAPEAKAESGGGHRNGSGAMPPVAPVPGSASALAAQAGQWAGAWTDAQDEVLIDAIAAAQITGTPKVDAITSAAIALGRSFKAVEQRSYRIGGRIKAEVARRAMEQAQTETPEIPAAESRPEPEADGDAAVGGHSPAAVQQQPSPEALQAAFARPMTEAPADLHGRDLELWHHLQAHRPRWPHTAGTDLDLVLGLSRGEKLPMISADLGIDPEKLKARFQTLTRPIQDAKGHITIDGGPRLIALLRRIVKSPAEAA